MSHHNGEHTTGTKNDHYNLISVLYHALEGAATYEKYIQDAEQSGDQELAQFFRQTTEQCSMTAERAKGLLAQRIGQQQAVAG